MARRRSDTIGGVRCRGVQRRSPATATAADRRRRPGSCRGRSSAAPAASTTGRRAARPSRGSTRSAASRRRRPRRPRHRAGSAPGARRAGCGRRSRRRPAGQDRPAGKVVPFGDGQLQGARERGDHLRRRRRGPALLQAHDVVDRDAGELGEFLPPQPGRPARPAGRQPGRRRRTAGPARRGSSRPVRSPCVGHDLDCPRAVPAGRGWYPCSYRRAVPGARRGAARRWSA